MGKRLVRIFNQHIVSKSQTFKGREADVVLYNKSTFHGRVTDTTDKVVLLTDKREVLHKIPLNEIDEIIYDFESSY